jgi:RNA polymerase sigma-70 factor (ECF subfamily)
MTGDVVPFVKKGQELTNRSDDELMMLSSQGVREAFAELVRRYARRVLGFFVKHVGDRQLGEEMAQETWLSVWAHRAEYRPEGKFVQWLFTLAHNRSRNLKRDRARRAMAKIDGDPAPAIERAADLSPNELDRLLIVERRARVDRALAGIPENLREAVLLRFTEELPYEDVARVLGTNESTARSRVFHGIRDLRRRLRGEPGSALRRRISSRRSTEALLRTSERRSTVISRRVGRAAAPARSSLRWSAILERCPSSTRTIT